MSKTVDNIAWSNQNYRYVGDVSWSWSFLREGERKWGCRVVGGTGSYQSSPTYYVDEGGIVTVGLRAPSTKGGFRMLKTKVAEILEGGGRFCRPRDRSYPVSTNFGPC